MVATITFDDRMHIEAGREARTHADHNRRVSQFCSPILLSHDGVDNHRGFENFSNRSPGIDENRYLVLLPSRISFITTSNPNSLDSFDGLSAFVNRLGKRDIA